MNMFKKNGGFTLVELIVVIAILAILAGVAVPAYSGYIKKANEAADIVTCDAVKTAVFAACTEKGQALPTTITISGGNVTAPSTLDKTAFENYYGSNTITLKYSSEATWTNGTWTLTPNP